MELVITFVVAMVIIPIANDGHSGSSSSSGLLLFHRLLFLSILSGLSTSSALFAHLPPTSNVRWGIAMLSYFAYLLVGV